MRLLIDGYNLLHVTGLLGRGRGPSRGPGVLERARERLIDQVADRLSPQEVDAAVIVFDARDVPRDRPDKLHRRGVTSLFAVDHADADELIIELVRRSSAPKNLLVVSSDHRVQLAASRRRARTIDSDHWWFDRPDASPSDARASAAPTGESKPLPDADEVRKWLREFGMLPDEMQ